MTSEKANTLPTGRSRNSGLGLAHLSSFNETQLQVSM